VLGTSHRRPQANANRVLLAVKSGEIHLAAVNRSHRVFALNRVRNQGFHDLPGEARDYFAVTGDRSFSIDSGWLEGTKAAGSPG